MACSVLGLDLAMPIAIAPTAMHRMAHSDGELATARGKLNIKIEKNLIILFLHSCCCPPNCVYDEYAGDQFN